MQPPRDGGRIVCDLCRSSGLEIRRGRGAALLQGFMLKDYQELELIEGRVEATESSFPSLYRDNKCHFFVGIRR
jgi:hypothetical protein